MYRVESIRQQSLDVTPATSAYFSWTRGNGVPAALLVVSWLLSLMVLCDVISRNSASVVMEQSLVNCLLLKVYRKLKKNVFGAQTGIEPASFWSPVRRSNPLGYQNSDVRKKFTFNYHFASHFKSLSYTLRVTTIRWPRHMGVVLF